MKELFDHVFFRPALALILMRTLPFAVYFCVDGLQAAAARETKAARAGTLEIGFQFDSRSVQAGRCSTKLLATGTWIALAAVLGFTWDMVCWVILITYFTLASAGVYGIEHAYRKRLLSAPAVFALLATMLVLLPGLFAPRPNGLLALLVGWELIFAAYSYCLEASRSSRAPTLTDCVFFLMVNPVLVYPDRGERKHKPGLHAQGLVGVVIGALGMLIGLGVGRPLVATLSSLRTQANSWIDVLGILLAYATVRFFHAYFMLAGDANLRVGLMRCLGYEISDCFDYPFLASSPTDFWRRWNAYMLTWLKRYVYRPLTAMPRLRRLGPLGLALAVVGTFVISGLTHELYAYVRYLHWTGRFTMQFSLFAAGIFAWLAMDRWLKQLTQRRCEDSRATLRVVRAWTARAVIVAAMATMPFVWG